MFNTNARNLFCDWVLGLHFDNLSWLDFKVLPQACLFWYWRASHRQLSNSLLTFLWSDCLQSGVFDHFDVYRVIIGQTVISSEWARLTNSCAWCFPILYRLLHVTLAFLTRWLSRFEVSKSWRGSGRFLCKHWCSKWTCMIWLLWITEILSCPKRQFKSMWKLLLNSSGWFLFKKRVWTLWIASVFVGF